ncbi:hypothetical protein IQ254_26165 [Nodosilinea sp. LEGE 07088]|uniref:hypothetical protein n=1 Tax=Nodosilinea sp. LEGE 07088 TaxID=2777968 RepID=UPI0018815165|nr:hypothetical protein [Nodosilinea sp. LEGE 07088]MBE9140644.1 hypothetical protein [Nodosilinea sp. LEGE 07088]
MKFEFFRDIKLARPSALAEWEVRYAAESNLRAKFPPGEYKKSQEINLILKSQFQFYLDYLNQNIQQVSSLDFLEFILYLFDLSSEIESLHKKGELSIDETQKWREIGPISRRALKYLSEKVVIAVSTKEMNKGRKARPSSLYYIAEKIIICSEEMAKIYQLSDISFSTFPDYSRLVILPPGQELYLEFEVTKDGILIGEQMHQRIVYDRLNRERFIPSEASIFNISVQNEIIGDAFIETIGLSYREMIGIISEIIRLAEPHSKNIPIPFINKNTVLREISRVSGTSKEILRDVISGFSLTKQKMEAEGREIWKPRQEYRAFKRGFFEVPHSTGKHLIFSKKMAIESLNMLVKGMVFKDIPSEWDNNKTQKAVSKLSNKAGQWFERNVEGHLAKIGFQGKQSVAKLKFQDVRMRIPDEVGEIDYQGHFILKGA